MVVGCIAIVAGERQCAGVEDMDVDLDSMVEEGIEAVVAAAQDHCSVFDLDNTRLYSREESHSIVGVPLEKVFAPRRTRSETSPTKGRSWYASVQWARGKLGCSSFEIALAAEKLRKCSRRPRLFGRKKHGRSCSDGYSYPAESHNLPYLVMKSWNPASLKCISGNVPKGCRRWFPSKTVKEMANYLSSDQWRMF